MTIPILTVEESEIHSIGPPRNEINRTMVVSKSGDVMADAVGARSASLPLYLTSPVDFSFIE